MNVKLLRETMGQARLPKETEISELPQDDTRLLVKTAVLLLLETVVHIELPLETSSVYMDLRPKGPCR